MQSELRGIDPLASFLASSEFAEARKQYAMLAIVQNAMKATKTEQEHQQLLNTVRTCEPVKEAHALLPSKFVMLLGETVVPSSGPATSMSSDVAEIVDVLKVVADRRSWKAGSFKAPAPSVAASSGRRSLRLQQGAAPQS